MIRSRHPPPDPFLSHPVEASTTIYRPTSSLNNHSASFSAFTSLMSSSLPSMWHDLKVSLVLGKGIRRLPREAGKRHTKVPQST
ncbi:hypothetical protein L596_013219 [Steinernema carpocapsae]|uniref:Uncharacterized protein n=1 Tax=Steinernema carpocapsae TaxID=34508 RepID=A0A4U5P003_STECR|nr:hypothetical protein L596_013219 [Steinernema carpocapsae]